MGKVMLITAADRKQLLANGAKSESDKKGIRPVIKIFNPYGGGTWLISEIDPNEPDRMFGLCDLGMGEPELGYVSFNELNTVKVGPGRMLYLERDRWFTADKSLADYAEIARNNSRIVA